MKHPTNHVCIFYANLFLFFKSSQTRISQTVQLIMLYTHDGCLSNVVCYVTLFFQLYPSLSEPNTAELVNIQGENEVVG